MPATYYPAVIERTASGFGVSFPDFPLVISGGDTVHDAAVSAEAALAFHLDSMRTDGDVIPAPSDLDSIKPVDGADDVARVLIRADLPGKFQRIQVTMDEGLLAMIDRVSHNRSGFLSDAARAALAADAAGRQLPKVPIPSAKPNPLGRRPRAINLGPPDTTNPSGI
jgi:predicted RNase H-like HicB family nuclease